MKINVFDDVGEIRLSTCKILFSERENGICTCLGTLDLPIVPEKKEVVREKIPRVGIECVKVEGEKLTEPLWIPENAYDIKLTYKVKE